MLCLTVLVAFVFAVFGRICLCLLDGEVLHGHRDYEQVVLDVKRSAKRFPPGYCALQSVKLAHL